MKTLLLFLLLLGQVGFAASSISPPVYPKNLLATNLPSGGKVPAYDPVRKRFYWTDGGTGGSATNVAVAPGNSIQTRTNSGVVTPELSGRTNFWNVLNYGAAVYPANSTTAFNDAATNLSFAGGTLWFPRVIYGITGTVAVQGSLGSGMPVAAFDYGNYTMQFDKHARVYCDVGTTNAFLFRTATSQWRKVEIMDGSLNGTNATGALLPTQVGMAFDGPSGNMKVARMNVQQMGVGFMVDDVTGVEFDNIMGIGCNVGFAWGYKPDGVEVVNSTFRNNRWGSWTMFTNAQFTIVSAQEGYPTFRNTVFGYNTNGAILHAYGMLMLDGCYFESNGPDTNSNVAVQIGYDTSDSYQQSYTNNAPSSSKPRLIWRNNGLNYKHAIKVYDPKGAEIYMYGPKIEGAAIPVVRLMVAGADNSIIRSDVNSPLWITNSSGTWFSVPMGYMFVSNRIVAISGSIFEENLVLTNPTPATAGSPKSSPTNILAGHGFNTSTSADVPYEVRQYILPTSTAGTPSMTLYWDMWRSNSFQSALATLSSSGHFVASGRVNSAAASDVGHDARNKWFSRADGTMQWTKNDTTTVLMSNTNGMLAIPGSLVVSSNSITNIITLANGDFRLAWSGAVDTLPSVITKDAAGTLKTNAFLNTTNVALLNGTNVFTGTNTFAEVIITNLIFIPTAWTGTTNTLNLNGSYQFYATANDLAITNLSGITAGQANWTTLRISNSSASTIVARNLVGSTVRLQGAASTNALSIPSTKVGFMSFLFADDTNSWTTVQQ